MPRFALHALVLTLVLGGVALVADALVVSDAELLDQLADDLTSGPADQRVDGVLAWMDLSRQPVRVQTAGNARHFEDEDSYPLADAVATALEPFGTGDVEVIQRSVSVDGDRGTVAVRARSGGQTHDAAFQVVRSGQGWVVSGLTAR